MWLHAARQAGPCNNKHVSQLQDWQASTFHHVSTYSKKILLFKKVSIYVTTFGLFYSVSPSLPKFLLISLGSSYCIRFPLIKLGIHLIFFFSIYYVMFFSLHFPNMTIIWKNEWSFTTWDYLHTTQGERWWFPMMHWTCLSWLFLTL